MPANVPSGLTTYHNQYGVTISALKRLKKEWQELRVDPPANATVAPVDEDDLFKWQATVAGPEDSPFDGGIFHVDIEIPKTYPLRPPKVAFRTKIFHPKISCEGMICLEMLNRKWSPVFGISHLLLAISSLLADENLRDPNPEHYMQPNIVRLYKKDNPKYLELARKWTRKYARPGIVSNEHKDLIPIPWNQNDGRNVRSRFTIV